MTDETDSSRYNHLAYPDVSSRGNLIELKFLIVCFLAPFLAACATDAAVAPSAAPVDRQSATTNTSHAGNVMSEKPRQPQSSESQAQSPEGIERKLLKLIDSIKARQELTLPRFKAMMEANEADSADAGDYEFQESVPGTGWTHSLSFSSDPGGFGYRLDHPSLHSDALDVDMSSVCGLDYDSYRRELVSMGYLEGPPTPDPINYERRGAISHTFSRNGVIVDILSAREGGAAAPSRQRNCIQQIEVWTTTEAKDGE